MCEDNVNKNKDVTKLAADLQKISEKLRYLVSPLNAVRFYLDDLIEDTDDKTFKKRLKEIGKTSDKCIGLVQDLVDLTMPYFDPDSSGSIPNSSK